MEKEEKCEHSMIKLFTQISVCSKCRMLRNDMSGKTWYVEAKVWKEYESHKRNHWWEFWKKY